VSFSPRLVTTNLLFILLFMVAIPLLYAANANATRRAKEAIYRCTLHALAEPHGRTELTSDGCCEHAPQPVHAPHGHAHPGVREVGGGGEGRGGAPREAAHMRLVEPLTCESLLANAASAHTDRRRLAEGADETDSHPEERYYSAASLQEVTAV